MTVRALVVDDSRTMQQLVSRELQGSDAISVVGIASSAQEARQMIKALDPDVVTLDIEMDGMSGLEFLERIMTLRPTPVVMVSSLTSEGAEASLTALEIGAIGCFDKRDLSLRGEAGKSSLVDLVFTAAKARTSPGFGNRAARVQSPAQAKTATTYRARDRSVIGIGASTGGVETLIELLRNFPVDCPPTVIVQHMPESFTKSFADRLDRLCPPSVEEARPGAVLAPGKVYLAPGGLQHLEIAGDPSRLHCRLIEGDKMNGHRPSVDRLFHSLARFAGANALGMILTGMGNDGAKGLLAMRNAGAMTLGQDQASSIVYGMPAEAFACGAVTEQLPLRRIGARALEWCRA